MSKTLAVAGRELRERWLLFPAGLVFGLNPLVLPAFGLDRDLMPVIGVVSAVLLGAAAALMMGSTMLARDAANGRLAFLFSRPVPWPAIWGGKWLASLALVTSAALLAAVPFMTVYPPRAHGGSWLRTLADEPGAAFLLTAVVLAVGLANFCATAYRSRSLWIALDMGLLAAGLWWARHSVAPLFRYEVAPLFRPEIRGHDDWSVALILVPLALALLLASAVQTAYGRTDVRRAHVSMSLVFWAIVGLNLAVAAGYWHWVRSAGPADLEVHALARGPAGRFVFVESSARRGGWYPYGHLIDTATGRWVARPEDDLEREGPPHGVFFSSDGRFGILPRSDGRGAAVVLLDLTADPPRATHVSLESSPPPGWTTSFAVSPSGDSVFMAHESGASIFALPSGRRVATATISPGWRPSATRFVDEATARAWLVPHAGSGVVSPRAEMRVVDLARAGRSSSRVFPVARAFGLPGQTWGAVRPDARGQRLVTFGSGVHLRDGATGAPLATLAESEQGVATTFLSDGRVVVGEPRLHGSDPDGPGATLRVFDRDGAKVTEMSLDLPPPGVSVGPEVAPGRILVASFRSPLLGKDGDTLVVDLTEGRVVGRLALRRLGPAMATWGPAASAARTDGGSVQFLQDEAGHVVRVDFETGARTTITGPGAPRGERIRVGW